MKLPNAERAVVDIEKLRNYALSSEHPRGRHKARVFAAALGLRREDAEDLRSALLATSRTQDAAPGEQDEYGQRYVIDFIMARGDRSAVVRSVWMVLQGEDSPRLVSCYVEQNAEA